MFLGNVSKKKIHIFSFYVEIEYLQKFNICERVYLSKGNSDKNFHDVYIHHWG